MTSAWTARFTARRVASLLALSASSALFSVEAVATARFLEDPAEAQDGASSAPEKERLSDPAVVKEALAQARERVAAIPADVTADSSEGRRRALLDARVALLVELEASQEGLEALATRTQELSARAARAKAILDRLAEAAPATDSDSDLLPTPEGLEMLRSSLEQARAAMLAARRASAAQQDELGQSGDRISEARARAAEAVTAAATAAAEVAQASDDAAQESDDAAKAMAELRLENARIEEAAAEARVRLLTATEDLIRAAEPVIAQEIDAYEQQVTALEEEVGRYEVALTAALKSEQEELAAEVALREEAAKRADTPAMKYLSEREAEVARSERNLPDLAQFQVAINRELDDNQKRLESSKEELESLQIFAERNGIGGRVGERIKVLHQQLPMRRRNMERSLQTGAAEAMPKYRARQFEVEDLLFSITESWPDERAKVVAELSEAEAAEFAQQATALRTRYRDALREERRLLTELLALAPKLHNVQLVRMETLDAMERFILSHLFRIRDEEPLGLSTIEAVPAEGLRLAGWGKDLAAANTQIRSALLRPKAFLFGVLLFPVLPFVLFRLRQATRRFVRTRNQRTIDRNATVLDRFLALAGGVVAAALLPAYVFAASRALDGLKLPESVGAVASTMLAQLSVVLFLWLLSRSFFADRSIAHVQLGLDLDASHALYRALRVGLLAWAGLLIPALVLRGRPFEAVAISRLLHTVFLLVVVFAVLRLLRARSPFVTGAVAKQPNSIAARYWGGFYLLVVALLLAVLALDSLGYRYGAQQIGNGLLSSLLTLLVLSAAYQLVSQSVYGLVRRRARRRHREADDESSIDTVAAEQQVRGFIRVAFGVGAVLLLARIWGIDEQALGALDEKNVYAIHDADGEVEHVSVADLLMFMVWIGGTIWVLRMLPGILELAVFPRFSMDGGLRYAIVTISRYLLFAMGVVVALSAIHLDLGRLGWLVAAMGVGLGFGLQEIVSNFVSGIILLLERPIRVGDLVTIGATSGTIKKINIRATTVMNFDQQEVIVPNRQLITGEVTNWTGSNKILRLVIPIGVAYGSDVDVVSNALMSVVLSDKNILKDPAPAVLFLNHGASSLDFEVRVFVPDPSIKMPLLDRMNKAINKELTRLGIEIPFPQQDIHIRSSVALPSALDPTAGAVAAATDTPA